MWVIQFPRLVLQSGLLWSPPRFCLTWPWNSFSCYLLFDRRTGNRPACETGFAIFGWCSMRNGLLACVWRMQNKFKDGFLAQFLKVCMWYEEDPQFQSGTTNSHGLHLSYSTRLMALEKLFSSTYSSYPDYFLKRLRLTSWKPNRQWYQLPASTSGGKNV